MVVSDKKKTRLLCAQPSFDLEMALIVQVLNNSDVMVICLDVLRLSENGNVYENRFVSNMKSDITQIGPHAALKT